MKRRPRTQTCKFIFSMKFRKLCSGFPQDGEVGISVLPEGKKLLKLVARVASVAGESITPSQAITSQHRDRIANHDSAMVDKLLILQRSLPTFVGGQISLTSKQDRVERSIEAHHGASGRAHFVGNRRFKRMDGSGGITAVEREDRVDYRQVTEADGCVLGESALQMVGEGLGLPGIACESSGDGCAVFDFAITGQPKSSGRALFRFPRIAEEGFPKGSPDGELRGPFAIALLLRQRAGGNDL